MQQREEVLYFRVLAGNWNGRKPKPDEHLRNPRIYNLLRQMARDETLRLLGAPLDDIRIEFYQSGEECGWLLSAHPPMTDHI